MRNLGIILMALGIGSFILPQIGFDLSLVYIFDKTQDTTAIVTIGIGIILASVDAIVNAKEQAVIRRSAEL